MKKKRIIAIIEKTPFGYTVYSDDLPRISGSGETVEDAKRNIKENISFILRRHDKRGTRPSPGLNNGLLVWNYKYDVESIFKSFPMVDADGFVRNLNLHPLLRYHKTGITLASEKQVQKITSNLHALGRELLSIHL